MTRHSKGLAEAARAVRARRRDVIDVRPVKPVTAEPTPEARQHADYAEQVVTDALKGGGISIKGRAYRRVARFERIEGLGDEQLRVLRYYRATFDASEMSETRCALDVRPGGAGGSDAAIARIEKRAFAGAALRAIERGIAVGLVATLRAIALEDLTFSDLAMRRFGSREVEKVVTGKGRQLPRIEVQIVPRSGKHREAVREEFFVALAGLVGNVRPHLGTGG